MTDETPEQKAYYKGFRDGKRAAHLEIELKVLPCDAMLPPATIYKKGTRMGALLDGMTSRKFANQQELTYYRLKDALQLVRLERNEWLRRAEALWQYMKSRNVQGSHRTHDQNFKRLNKEAAQWFED